MRSIKRKWTQGEKARSLLGGKTSPKGQRRLRNCKIKATIEKLS